MAGSADMQRRGGFLAPSAVPAMAWKACEYTTHWLSIGSVVVQGPYRNPDSPNPAAFVYTAHLGHALGPRIASAEITYLRRSHHVHIELLWSDIRQAGLARLLMERLLGEFDGEISLHVYPQDDSIDVEELVAFYHRLGFEETYDASPDISMRRRGSLQTVLL